VALLGPLLCSGAMGAGEPGWRSVLFPGTGWDSTEARAPAAALSPWRGCGKFPAAPGPGLGMALPRQAPGHLLKAKERKAGAISHQGQGKWCVFCTCTIWGPAAFSESDKKFQRKKSLLSGFLLLQSGFFQ
jgi:hypothetical protein